MRWVNKMTDKLKAAVALGMFISSEEQFTEASQQQAMDLAGNENHPMFATFSAIEFAVRCVPHADELHNDKLFGMVHALKENFAEITGGNAARREFMKAWLAKSDEPQSEPQSIPEIIPVSAPDAAAANTSVLPPYFEPGRYEGVSNNDYHSSNGISSSQVKDARVSLMYFHGRHIAKTIQKESTEALTFGTLVHALVLEPETIEAEFSVEPVIPGDAFTNTASMKAFIEAYNATLPAPVGLGSSVDDTREFYSSLPAEFQTIDLDGKPTATAMKDCIKAYNATLPAQLKAGNSKETAADAIRSIKPDAVFADEIMGSWQQNADNKVMVTRRMMELGTAIQQAVFNHPEAGQIVNHETRAVEVSYYGMDEDTGLEIRVRPDLEITYGGLRVGFDLKTVSLGRIKQASIRSRIHREIIDRDYHVSAAMYCDTADLDQFFWIFVNKDEGYHWIAIVEASAEEIELGQLEYKQTLKDIRQAMDTGVWPAPFTSALVDELNDFDLRRLDALRTNA